MEYFESDIFGRLSAPSNFSEFLSLVLDPPNKTYFNAWMWRGQANIEWPVHSGAYRRLLRDKSNPTERDVQYYENRLLANASHKGYRRFEGTELSDFDLLARLQHHGAATRLLDATRSVLVGLYFSCNQLPDKWGALIGFHTDYLGGGEGRPISGDYKEVVDKLTQYGSPQTWEPPSISPRVAAQRSQFLYSAITDSPLGSLKINDQQESMLGIAISPDMKSEFLHVLSGTFDVRGVSLFPDLDGFCDFNTASYGQYFNERW